MRIVVLGTGTGVGKSYVAVAVARALHGSGTVRGLKPVESGCDPLAADAAALAEASNVRTPPKPALALRAPVSPHLAARMEGQRIELATLVAWVDAFERTDFIVIESAGGAFSPLNDDQCNADLAERLAPDAVLLVAPDRLGVLHDVRACSLALERYALPPPTVVLSAPAAPDPSTGTNARELLRLGYAASCFTCARHHSAPPELTELLLSSRDDRARAEAPDRRAPAQRRE